MGVAITLGNQIFKFSPEASFWEQVYCILEGVLANGRPM